MTLHYLLDNPILLTKISQLSLEGGVTLSYITYEAERFLEYGKLNYPNDFHVKDVVDKAVEYLSSFYPQIGDIRKALEERVKYRILPALVLWRGLINFSIRFPGWEYHLIRNSEKEFLKFSEEILIEFENRKKERKTYPIPQLINNVIRRNMDKKAGLMLAIWLNIAYESELINSLVSFEIVRFNTAVNKLLDEIVSTIIKLSNEIGFRRDATSRERLAPEEKLRNELEKAILSWYFALNGDYLGRGKKALAYLLSVYPEWFKYFKEDVLFYPLALAIYEMFIAYGGDKRDLDEIPSISVLTPDSIFSSIERSKNPRTNLLFALSTVLSLLNRMYLVVSSEFSKNLKPETIEKYLVTPIDVISSIALIASKKGEDDFEVSFKEISAQLAEFYSKIGMEKILAKAGVEVSLTPDYIFKMQSLSDSLSILANFSHIFSPITTFSALPKLELSQGYADSFLVKRKNFDELIYEYFTEKKRR
ncbi:hypothetical protein P8X24_11005 [Pyrococcus kukulkanii]|uniref:hypothetical protein n=1 Tax=Pyrococcus kukulkanii TaxID=1609559 RepID=UPI00356AB2CA